MNKNLKGTKIAKSKDIISCSSKDTKEIAEKLFSGLKIKKSKATVVGMYGDLGTGKTTFIQHFAKEAGVKKKVHSPTFSIMQRYLLKHKDLKNLFHIDAYRLKNEKELLSLGWDKILDDPENLVFIEWPEKVKSIMPKGHHQIHISHTKEGYRKFKIKKG